MRRAWLALLILCSTAGCDLLPTGPSGKPDVVGVVRALEYGEIASNSVPSIVVEVRHVRSSARALKGCGGESQFYLSASTRIQWASGGVAAPDDLLPGRKVSVWIVAGSPVTLSCTPGAAAARIRLE